MVSFFELVRVPTKGDGEHDMVKGRSQVVDTIADYDAPLKGGEGPL